MSGLPHRYSLYCKPHLVWRLFTPADIETLQVLLLQLIVNACRGIQGTPRWLGKNLKASLRPRPGFDIMFRSLPPEALMYCLSTGMFVFPCHKSGVLTGPQKEQVGGQKETWTTWKPWHGSTVALIHWGEKKGRGGHCVLLRPMKHWANFSHYRRKPDSDGFDTECKFSSRAVSSKFWLWNQVLAWQLRMVLGTCHFIRRAEVSWYWCVL